MAVILNPRGTSGSGKTELARRILEGYGWRRNEVEDVENIEPIHRGGREAPYCYRLRHPSEGRPIVVFGDYQRTSGGCDTIRARDGGLPEVMRVAGDYASGGHDVLIEGLRLSSEVTLSAQLAAGHGLHVVLLSTPLEQCVSNLVGRRRAGRSSLPAIERATVEEHRRVHDACARLHQHATVEVLDFKAALARARELLELDHLRAPA